MEIVIDENYEGVRVDKYLRKKLPDVSLGNIFKMIRTGNVKINGKKTKENYDLKIGDVLKIYPKLEIVEEKIEEIEISKNAIETIKKAIVYETDELSIINKPAGMVAHKGSEHRYGLIEILKKIYISNDIALINRIDKTTSGLVIAGKTPKAIRDLSELLRNGKIEKYYYIICRGTCLEDTFSIVSKLEKGEEKSFESEAGKESISHFKVLKRDNGYVFLEAKLETGRTHQLRVQLAEKKLPIVGDYKYGVQHGKKMYLFSHRIVIKDKEIDIDLEIPEGFEVR